MSWFPIHLLDSSFGWLLVGCGMHTWNISRENCRCCCVLNLYFLYSNPWPSGKISSRVVNSNYPAQNPGEWRWMSHFCWGFETPPGFRLNKVKAIHYLFSWCWYGGHIGTKIFRTEAIEGTHFGMMWWWLNDLFLINMQSNTWTSWKFQRITGSSR